MPKYPQHNNAIIKEDTYSTIFKRKGVTFLKIKRTKTFEKVKDLEMEVIAEHVWSKNDNLLRLSQEYYGVNKFWWAIGLANKKPTDGHYNIGDIVYIPKNPVLITEAMR